jgi:hypothetical protein
MTLVFGKFMARISLGIPTVLGDMFLLLSESLPATFGAVS